MLGHSSELTQQIHPISFQHLRNWPIRTQYPSLPFIKTISFINFAYILCSFSTFMNIYLFIFKCRGSIWTVPCTLFLVLFIHLFIHTLIEVCRNIDIARNIILCKMPKLIQTSSKCEEMKKISKPRKSRSRTRSSKKNPSNHVEIEVKTSWWWLHDANQKVRDASKRTRKIGAWHHC